MRKEVNTSVCFDTVTKEMVKYFESFVTKKEGTLCYLVSYSFRRLGKYVGERINVSLYND